MKGIDAFDRRYSMTGYLLLLVIFLPALAFVILNNYQTVPAFFNNSEALKQIGFPLLTALTISAAALVLAFPGIIIYAKCPSRVRSFLRVSFAFAFCFPVTLMSMSLENEYLNLSPFFRAAIANLALNIPLVIVMVGEYLRRLDIRQKLCSRTIGVSESRFFITLTLPKLVPAFSGVFALVLLRCMAPTDNIIVSMLLSVLFLIILTSTDNKRSQAELSPADSETRKGNTFTAVLSFIYMVAAQCLIIVPLLFMILRSVLINGRISFEAYRLLFAPGNDKLLMCLVFCLAIALASSVIASFISVRICVGIANTGCSLFVAMIPFAIGPVALASGFTGLYPWLGQTLTVKLIFTVLCHILILTPIQVMILLPVVRTLSPNLRKTSVSLGKTSSQSFMHIDLKLMETDILCALFTSIAISIASYGAAETYGLYTAYTQCLMFWQQGKVSDASAIGSITLILSFIFFVMGIGHTREGKRNV